MARHRVAAALGPRSVVPGRQRWDVGFVSARPDLSRRLEALLGGQSGVERVYANPLTGRLLVHHVPTLSAADVDRLVRAAVTRITGPSGPPTRPRSTWLTGAAVSAVVLSTARRSSPARFGLVVAAAGAVVRRAWRRSAARSPAGRPRSPLRRIIGPRHRRGLRVAVAMSVAVQLLDMVPAVLLSWMTFVLTSGSSPVLAGLGLSGVAVQLTALAAVAALAVAVVAVLARSASARWRALAESVRHDWLTTTYAHVQRVSTHHLDERRATRIARVLTDDVNELSRFLASSADYFLQLGVRLVVLVPLFGVFAPRLAWVAFLPVPVIAHLSLRHHERSITGQAAHAAHAGQLTSRVITTSEASGTVRGFGAEEYETERVRALSAAYEDSGVRLGTRAATYTQAVRAATMTSILGVVLLGGHHVLSGTLSPAAFALLANLPQRTVAQLPMLGSAVDQYQRAVAALGRVLELHDLPVEETGTGAVLSSAAGDLRIDRVTFGYPGRAPVFRDLSMRFPANRTTAIVGASGAGKTTIAKLLLRFYEPTSGRLLLGGTDLGQLRLGDLRRAIGFVSQEAVLFDGTIAENIRYGTFDATDDQVASAARLAGAAEFVEALPERYATVVGERGVALSGGQRQRISLARVILRNPPIAVLDEATSAVDNETEAAIQRAMRDFSRHRTVLVIAHRLSTVRHADLIYVLDGTGNVVEEGTHAQLVGHGGAYAALWRLQIGE